MNQPVEIFLGFDPGGRGRGRGNFGWSICRDNAGELEQLHSGLGRYAADVVEQVLDNLPPNACVRAAGIDAPMFWDRTGRLYRYADEIIRGACGRPVSINGLYGAVVAQGVLVASLLRERFDDLAITEAFPSALRRVMRLALPPVLGRCENETEHERDARTAAYAAWRMHQNAPGWRDLFLEEPDPFLPLGNGTPVSYWMPIP